MNEFLRTEMLLDELLVVDGMPGCGKSLFCNIFSSLERIEIMQYSPTIENLCTANYSNKISPDALSAMIKCELDLLIYHSMMGRNTNFRFDDVSSAFNNKLFFKYFFRLFSKGNENIPELINTKRPILHLTTHNLLAYIQPIIDSIGEKLKIVEIIRHPLYMIIQQSINHQKFAKDKSFKRQFHIMNETTPFYYEEIGIDYKKLNSTERAIYEMNYHFEKTNKFKKIHKGNNILTIPFELFVKNPNPWLNKILTFLNTSKGKKTNKILKQQKVPRKYFADGISLDVYKKCGWEPPKGNLNESQEMELRIKYVMDQNVSSESLSLIKKISENYEKKYNIFNIN